MNESQAKRMNKLAKSIVTAISASFGFPGMTTNAVGKYVHGLILQRVVNGRTCSMKCESAIPVGQFD